MHGRSERGAVTWRCLCHRCGNEAIIEGQRMTDKRTPKVDCGCAYREKCADLTGKTVGVLDVLEYVGIGKSGDRCYRCRCHLCGCEKILPAVTIRAKLKSCGCQRYTLAKMQAMAKLAVDATIIDGVNIPAVTRTDANKNSQTGVRGVIRMKNGTYRAHCQVHGERWIQDGFLSVESAKRARDKMQSELIKKYKVGVDHD